MLVKIKSAHFDILIFYDSTQVTQTQQLCTGIIIFSIEVRNLKINKIIEPILAIKIKN